MLTHGPQTFQLKSYRQYFCLMVGIIFEIKQKIH